MQQRGANIEEVRAIDAFVFFDTGSLCNKDAELAMLDGWSSRFAGDAGRTQMVGMKTMVRHENYGCVLAGESEERSQHHVVVAVPPFEAIVENAEVPVVDVV